jgi:hypothetical protein
VIAAGKIAILLVISAVLVSADERTRKLAARLPEEAALFVREATKVVSEETLHQRAVKDIVATGPGTVKPVWQDKVIVSRYGFVSFHDAPDTLREMRQIESIDGKASKTEKSLKAVASAITASDEHQKRKLIEDFEKAGLVGVATDLGQLLLLFSGRKIQNYDFSFQSQKFVGADRVMVFTYSQIEGGGMTVYRGKDTLRPKLSGEVWVDGDYRPLKITLNSTAQAADKNVIRQEIEVRYSPSLIPCVLPTYARHREIRDGVVQVENVYQYSDFRSWEEARK